MHGDDRLISCWAELEKGEYIKKGGRTCLVIILFGVGIELFYDQLRVLLETVIRQEQIIYSKAVVVPCKGSVVLTRNICMRAKRHSDPMQRTA